MAGGDGEHVTKVRNSKFNRQRDGEVLRANCGGEGYVISNPGAGNTVNAARRSEFHHVLPISSLQDGVILDGKKDEVMDFIHKCMAKTVWDTNEQPNLLGLPTKQPYDDADRIAANPKLKYFGALPDLPCHMNDHDKYTQAVIDKLNEELWPNLIDERDVCKDPGESIASLLKTQSNNWKTWLKNRGIEHGGAAHCWVNRKKKRSVWYIPLSMAPDPRKSEPPPNIHDRPEGMRIPAWLEKIFSWAG